MITLDNILVGLIITLALLHLFRAFRPKPNRGGCGCGSINCKVPKPELKQRQ